jgi:aspartate aminotransferase
LNALYQGFIDLKSAGFPVNAVPPQATIYLAVQFDLKGFKTPSGQKLHTTEAVTQYLLDEADFALVPFHAFGFPRESSWYRISVGTALLEEIPPLMKKLRGALERLSSV